MFKVKFGGLVLLLVLSVVACAPEVTPEPTPPTEAELIIGMAPVEEIDILILESFPVQVNVVVDGYLPDGCTEINEITQKRNVEAQTFEVEITTIRPADALCTEAMVPFEETISLDVEGLPAGTYTVDVNGVTGTFTLQVDNVLPEG